MNSRLKSIHRSIGGTRCYNLSSTSEKSLDSFRFEYVRRNLENLASSKPLPVEGFKEVNGENRLKEGDRVEERLPHRWPEWTELMVALKNNGYLDRSDYSSSSKHSNRVRTACLDYARDRSELIRYLSREDIHLLAGAGCPSSDRKVTNSAKRLRAFVGIDEGKVCSSCRLRGSCERAYLGARQEERGRTIDVMRLLLTLGLDLETENSETQPFLKKTVEDSARRMLRGMVELGMKGMSPPETRAEPNILMKQGDWTCPKCGFLNFAKNVKCLRCDVLSEAKTRMFKKEFEHLPLKKGDWICRKCNFLNFAKNTRCLQCEEKPTGRQLNPGEWECASCNYVNFRKNEYCLKCSWKRPKAAVSAAVKVGIGEEPSGLTSGQYSMSSISFVQDVQRQQPLTMRKQDDDLKRETTRSSTSSMDSSLDGLDGSSDEDDMAGWFVPPGKDTVRLPKVNK